MVWHWESFQICRKTEFFTSYFNVGTNKNDYIKYKFCQAKNIQVRIEIRENSTSFFFFIKNVQFFTHAQYNTKIFHLIIS